MAGLNQAAVERVREYLRALKPGARALLIAELERNILRGEDVTGAELILTELRRSFREAGVKSQRIGDHARAFSDQVERALLSSDTDKAEQLAHAFQDRAAERMLEALDAVKGDDKA